LATQAERKRQAIAGLRKLRQEYRKTKTSGDKAQREMNRLILRKTLVSAEDVSKLSKEINEYMALAEALQRAFAILMQILVALG